MYNACAVTLKFVFCPSVGSYNVPAGCYKQDRKKGSRFLTVSLRINLVQCHYLLRSSYII